MFLSSLFRTGYDFVKSATAPVRCASCGRYGSWLCGDCRDAVALTVNQRCYRCNKLSESGKTCSICRSSSALTGVVVACHYEGVIRRVIHRYKYAGNRELSTSLAQMMMESMPALAGLGWKVVAVPTHRHRVWDRGFDHSAELAKALAAMTGLPVIRPLIKVGPARRQVGLRRAERITQIRGTILPKEEVAGRIILVDDVATTGATLEECARCLRSVGATRVYAIVIARGV